MVSGHPRRSRTRSRAGAKGKARHSGELPKPDKKNLRYVISEHLLEDAKNQNPRNKFLTADELGRSLREMGCTHKSNGKKWGWIFPPLPEARDAWRAQSGEWEWLAPEIEEWGEKPER